ncbi:MAG: hypothetical protein OXC71_09635 [Chloroflexi bacterium]|nr:hypothetical protein [Chloroflexota bacterium]
MAKSKTEVLRLTVPRRHILVAMLAVSVDPARPLLGSICFRPANPAGARSGDVKGKLRTIASNGHKLVSMIGGTWKGTWPTGGRDVVIPPTLFSRKRAKKLLDTTVTVQALDDGSVTVFDNAADHQAVGCDVGSCFLRYPDVDGILKRYRRYAVARKAVGLNASYLEEMGRIGEVFQDHEFNRLHVTLRRRNLSPKGQPDEWAPVFDASAKSQLDTRTLDVLLMGLRAAA